MDSAPKHHSLCEYSSLKDYDRISNLPDSILCHIISFLPTTQALATSILSTRWKNLFAQTPNLKLCFDDCLHPIKSASQEDRAKYFITFVNKVFNLLIHEGTHIRELHLGCAGTRIDAYVVLWLLAAVQLNVQRLVLSIAAMDSKLLFHSLSGCKSLVKLHLGSGLVLSLQELFILPNLKNLFFDNIKFDNTISIKMILHGCPVLEDLTIYSCTARDANDICIHMPLLKYYIMEDCNAAKPLQIVLDAPNLKLFHYSSTVAQGYIVKTPNSLRAAHVNIKLLGSELEEERGLDLARKILQLVRVCSNVRRLFISKFCITALHCSSETLPTFRNLTWLQLGQINGISGLKVLGHLLQSAPILETLIIAEGFEKCEGGYASFESLLQRLPTCLSLHMKEIEVRELKGNEDEIKLIEFFLQNAKVLQKMHLKFQIHLKEQLRVWNRLLAFPVHSKACQFI